MLTTGALLCVPKLPSHFSHLHFQTISIKCSREKSAENLIIECVWYHWQPGGPLIKTLFSIIFFSLSLTESHRVSLYWFALL